MKTYWSILVLGMHLISCQEKSSSTSDERPNIIWLVSEDQSPYFFPMYGDSTISLPNIESLATEGVTFDRAYAPVPVCAPARSAIITGMYPTTLGTHNMRTYNAFNPTNEGSINVPSYSPIVPKSVKCFTEYLRTVGYYCTNNSKEDYNFEKPASTWDDSSSEAHWRNRKQDQPFFSVFNYGITHESQIWKKAKDSLLVDPSTVPVPPFYPDDSVIRKDLAINYSNLIRMDDQIGEIINQLKEDGLYENSIIFFYGDHGGPFPRYKRALYETGTQVPMIIKFPKQYDKVGRENVLMSFIDLAPTLLSLAGINPPEVMQGKALYGKYKDEVERQYLFTSSDRFDAEYDRIRAVRSDRYKYIRNFEQEKPYALPIAYREQMPTMRRLRELKSKNELNDSSMLWMADDKPKEELYDLTNDPYELNNLIDDQQLADTLNLLRKTLEEWMISSNDLGEIPEQELINQWLVDGKQPQLELVDINEEEDKIVLNHRVSDATIIWQAKNTEGWSIYSQPIQKSLFAKAKVVRIGYIASDEIILE